MVENDVGLPPVANASAGLGPIPDQPEQTELDMTAKESKITVVGTNGEEAPAPKKRGRKPGSTNGAKKRVEAVAVQTTCSVKVRYRLRSGEKIFEVQTGGKASTPQQVQALFLKWAREVENRWAKI